MLTRRFPALAAAGLLAFTPRLALSQDEAPVATGRTQAPVPKAEPAAPLSTEAAIEDFLSDPPPEPRRRKAHGTVGAAIGSGGYREVGGSVVVPVGENGVIAAEVVMAEGGQRPGRRSGPSQ